MNIFCYRIPAQHECYLTNENYPTLKFNTTKDEPGDKGWRCRDSKTDECIPERYICDKTGDCLGSSDEVWGCDLYSGNLNYRMFFNTTFFLR